MPFDRVEFDALLKAYVSRLTIFVRQTEEQRLSMPPSEWQVQERKARLVHRNFEEERCGLVQAVEDMIAT